MTYSKYAQPTIDRAYSTFSVKASDRDDGTIIGIASTIETDRVGDVLIPTGMKYQLPVPLLWMHSHRDPLGSVTSIKATSRGVEIVAKIAVNASDEINRIYRLVKAGVVRGLSVGFRPLEQPESTKTGFLFKKWELLELSIVSVPANSGAGISAVKSACGVSLAHDFIPLRSAKSGSVPLLCGSVPLQSARGGPVSLLPRRNGSVKLHTGSVRLITGRR